MEGLRIDNAKASYIERNFPRDYAKRVADSKEHCELQKYILKLTIEYGNTHQLVESSNSSKSDGSKKNSNKWSCYVKLRGITEK